MSRRLLVVLLLAGGLTGPAHAAHYTLRAIVTAGGKVGGKPIEQILWFDAGRGGEVAFAIRTTGGAEALYEYKPTPKGPGHGKIHELAVSDAAHPLGGFALAGDGEVAWARGDPTVHTSTGDPPLCDVFIASPTLPATSFGRVCSDPLSGTFMSGVQAVGGHEASEFAAAFSRGTRRPAPPTARSSSRRSPAARVRPSSATTVPGRRTLARPTSTNPTAAAARSPAGCWREETARSGRATRAPCGSSAGSLNSSRVCPCSKTCTGGGSLVTTS